jgi:hypothetical protein
VTTRSRPSLLAALSIARRVFSRPTKIGEISCGKNTTSRIGAIGMTAFAPGDRAADFPG